MENKHVEHPSMPFDIDDVVYYMEKVLEQGGHSGYKIIKTKCAGYWNFGDGWKIAFKNKKGRLSITEIKSLPVSDVGYTIFDNKNSVEDRIKELNGFIVK